MPKRLYITNRVFGKLKVIADAPSHITQKGRPVRMVFCACDCGKTFSVRCDSLINGQKSCGCSRMEINDKTFLKHGYARHGGKHPTYLIWCSMIQRCKNPRSKQFYDYGGRGISVCERWINSFQCFIYDMGERPDGMTLERIDNDLGYCKENCKWDSRKNQNRNKRNVIHYTFSGVSGCLKDLAAHFEINYSTLRYRILKYGWSVEKAFTTPIKTRAGSKPARV